MKRCLIISVLSLTLGALSAANSMSESDKGVGPVTEIKLSADIDAAMVEKGKGIFETKCSACHKWEEKYVGPALKGVTKRREPEWILNMILNPQEMTQKNPTAKALFEEILIQMTPQNLTEQEARTVLEYFRKLDSQ